MTKRVKKYVILRCNTYTFFISESILIKKATFLGIDTVELASDCIQNGEVNIIVYVLYTTRC